MNRCRRTVGVVALVWLAGCMDPKPAAPTAAAPPPSPPIAFQMTPAAAGVLIELQVEIGVPAPFWVRFTTSPPTATAASAISIVLDPRPPKPDEVIFIGIGLASIARALVAIAGASSDSVPHQADAFDVWADLLAARAGSLATR